MLLHIDNAKAFLAQKSILSTEALELSEGSNDDNVNVINLADSFGNMVELTYNKEGYLDSMVEFDVAENLSFKTVYNWNKGILTSEDHYSDGQYQFTNTEELIY